MSILMFLAQWADKSLDMSEHEKNADHTISGHIFTVDSEDRNAAEVPEMTKLLSRKKPVTPPPTPEVAAETTQEKPPSSGPKIHPVIRKKAVQAPVISPMKHWSLAELSSTNDPLQKGLHAILQRIPVRAVLFSGTPLRSSAMYGAGDLTTLWTGLVFSADVFPDLWKMLMTTGFISIGKSKPSDSPSRRLFKSFLGVPATESLVIIYYESSLLILMTNDEITTVDQLPCAFPFLDASKAFIKTG
jgi:hypothetical protein